MNIILNIKNKLIILSFTLYIFFWSMNFSDFLMMRYLVIIPFLFALFEKNILLRLKIKYYLLIPLFLISHYFLTNLINITQINLNDFLSIVFMCIIIFSFLIYRHLLLNNFANILKLFFISLIIFSMINNQIVDVGSCSENFYSFFPFFLKLSLSKGIFSENSHLAMMNIGAILSASYIYIKTRDVFLLFLTISSVIINILNLSTTFILGYILCSVIFLIFVKDKYFKIFLIIILSLFCFLYSISDDCSKKLSDINFNDIQNNEHKSRKSGELTSNIYERSIIISLKTLQTKPLGWGYGGSKKAVNDYINNRRKNNPQCKYFDAYSKGICVGVPDTILYKGKLRNLNSLVWVLNKEDSLGNIFKLTIEFGYLNIFFIILFFNFIKNRKITEYEIFFISLFLVQLFRGAGYINGAFIICIIEIFLIKYLIAGSLHPKKKSPSFS